MFGTSVTELYRVVTAPSGPEPLFGVLDATNSVLLLHAFICAVEG